jgi:hypothetical protein
MCSGQNGEENSVEDQVVKKLEQFNSVCDELYKEIVREKCDELSACANLI